MSTHVGPLALFDDVVVVLRRIEELEGEPTLPADLETAARMPRSHTREHLAGRALLRRLLREVDGPDAATSPIATRERGQPYLVRRPETGVSVSHSGSWIAAGLCRRGAVGVDVQMPVSPSRRLLERCCGASARSALSRLSVRHREIEFGWIWTVQEACVKAVGLGIAGRPWTIPVEVGQSHGLWRDVTWISLRDLSSVPLSCARGHTVMERAPLC